MPITDLASGPVDNLGAIPGANVVGSITGGGTPIRKRFISVDKNPTSSGNGVTGFDDPTYLGFTLKFDITSPLFNGATSGSAGATPASGVGNNSIEGNESAIGYLKAVGELNRANYLKAFIQGIIEINQTRPYYWQAIEGLNEAWGKASDMGPDPYNGSGDGEGIVISCLEAVDLKLTALFSLYRLAVYDNKYRRYVVPENLRHFDVDVRVGEIRQFKKTINYLGLISGGRTNPNSAASVVGDNASFVEFKFRECEWMAEECGKLFDTVGNGESTVAGTSIKWSYANTWIDGEFAGYDSALLDSRNQNAGNGNVLGNFAKETATQLGEGVLNSAVNSAERAVVARAQSLLFGNVHGGVQNTIANTLQNPGGAIVNATIGGIGSGQASGSEGTPIRLNENILPEADPIPKSLPTDSIIPPPPSGPPPLTPDNVHG